MTTTTSASSSSVDSIRRFVSTSTPAVSRNAWRARSANTTPASGMYSAAQPCGKVRALRAHLVPVEQPVRHAALVERTRRRERGVRDELDQPVETEEAGVELLPARRTPPARSAPSTARDTRRGRSACARGSSRGRGRARTARAPSPRRRARAAPTRSRSPSPPRRRLRPSPNDQVPGIERRVLRRMRDEPLPVDAGREPLVGCRHERAEREREVALLRALRAAARPTRRAA